MVPKSGTRFPKLPFSLSDVEFAELIAEALQQELGGSRRASKTIMAWTGVTDHTARAWLNGRKSPSSVHLLGLAAKCPSVMTLLLRLTGHDRVGLGIELIELEAELERMLAIVQTMRSADGR